MRSLHVLATAAAMALVAPTALAADGQIDFEGEVTANTCVINGGATAPMKVILPRVNRAQFDQPDSSAAHTRFVIKLSGCGGGGPTKARAFFEANGPWTDYTHNVLKNLDTSANKAEGLGFALYNEADRARIQIGSSRDVHGSTWVNLSSGTADLGYEVSYRRLAAQEVIAGKISGSVQYAIDYD